VKAFPPEPNALEAPYSPMVLAPCTELHPFCLHFFAKREVENRKCGGLTISLAPQFLGSYVDAEASDPLGC
jgi:hypothetical protein